MPTTKSMQTKRQPTNTETIHELVESYSQLARDKSWMVCSKVYEDNAFVTAWAPVNDVNWCRLIRYRNGIKVFHDTKLGNPIEITEQETKAIEDIKQFTS
jgi:hypothetical protein